MSALGTSGRVTALITAAALLVGCADSKPDHPLTASTSPALLRLDDLPAGWSEVPDSLPVGFSLNNGGPVGRFQAANCVREPAQGGSTVQASNDFGLGNARAWDVVVTGGNLNKSFAQLTSHTVPPPDGVSSSVDCFLGVGESETSQVNLGLFGGFSGMAAQPTATPIDLGSHGLRTDSQQLTLPFTVQGANSSDSRSGTAYLVVSVTEFRHEIVAVGFWSLNQPIPTSTAKEVTNSVAARAA